MVQNKEKKKITNRNLQDAIFFAVMVILPTLQFLIFFVGVRFETILLSFQRYDTDKKGLVFDAWYQYSQVFQYLKTDLYKRAIVNSLVGSLWSVGGGILLGLIFSLYIYKQQFGSKVVKVLLFMPSIICPIILVKIFQIVVGTTLPALLNQIFGVQMKNLLSGTASQKWGVVIFYTLWSGFGSPILLYVGAMNSISESVVEAAKLDGCSMVRESVSITLPLIYPTITVYVISGVAMIFNNQMNLYSFGTIFADGIETIGYQIFKMTYDAQGRLNSFPEISAFGVFFTLIAVPTTYFIKWLMNKFGPSVE